MTESDSTTRSNNGAPHNVMCDDLRCPCFNQGFEYGHHQKGTEASATAYADVAVMSLSRRARSQSPTHPRVIVLLEALRTPAVRWAAAIELELLLEGLTGGRLT